MKTLLLVIASAIFFGSCAQNKTFTINHKQVTVEPYGWANSDALKNDSIVYQVSAGNVACSIIFCEKSTIIIYWRLYFTLYWTKSFLCDWCFYLLFHRYTLNSISNFFIIFRMIINLKIKFWSFSVTIRPNR